MTRRAIERSCSVEGCDSEVKAKGLCPAHYRMNRLHGRTHRIVGVNVSRKCEWDGCNIPARACGYCRSHYKVARREGILHPGKYQRDHPLYGMWWARRKESILVPEWHEDFWAFAEAVGEKPGKFYSLVTLREGPFGPDNFEWRAHIKRNPGESKRAFHARKWQAQNERRPGWDSQRSLKRKYGITGAEYNSMLKAQGGVCAICHGPEKKIDHKTRLLRRLAVDHCHVTGKVRGLLCSRCNMTIGHIDESLELLRSMEMYMQRHLNNALL